MKRIKAKGINVIVYEPSFSAKSFWLQNRNDLIKFKKKADLVVATGWTLKFLM